MDPITLVDRRIEDGRKLLLQMGRDGFDVAAMFWLRVTEDDAWHLYVAAQVVDQEGPAGAYRKLQTSQQKLYGTSISLAEVRLIGLSHPFAKAAVAWMQKSTRHLSIECVGASFGEGMVEGVYVYPPLFRPNQTHNSLNKVRLKGEVEQSSSVDELLSPLSAEERRAMEQMIVAAGISPDQADYWVRKRRERKQTTHPPISAGSVVDATITAWWGDIPDEDPNPLLEVVAENGARGLTFKDNTEPFGSGVS